MRFDAEACDSCRSQALQSGDIDGYMAVWSEEAKSHDSKKSNVRGRRYCGRGYICCGTTPHSHGIGFRVDPCCDYGSGEHGRSADRSGRHLDGE